MILVVFPKGGSREPDAPFTHDPYGRQKWAKRECDLQRNTHQKTASSSRSPVSQVIGFSAGSRVKSISEEEFTEMSRGRVICSPNSTSGQGSVSFTSLQAEGRSVCQGGAGFRSGRGRTDRTKCLRGVAAGRASHGLMLSPALSATRTRP